MYNELLNFEFSILDSIAKIHNPLLDKIMVFFTTLGDKGIVWIVMALVLLAFKRTRKIGLCVSISLLLDLVIVNIILKPLVARIRPFDIKKGVELIVNMPTDFSFPSGHTCAAFAASFALLFNSGKWGIVSLVFACIISFSRLYLYVHYPTDVMAGIVIGFLLGLSSVPITNKIAKKYSAKLRL